MKRLALLMTLLGLSSACFAEEPAFCKSMCTSEKTQCLARAVETEKREGILASESDEKNPFARTAQVHTRSSGDGALEQSGLQHRRMTRAGTCDDAYQRCTRSCKVDGKDDAVGKVVARHVKKQN
jgi:hypothetical protein